MHIICIYMHIICICILFIILELVYNYGPYNKHLTYPIGG